MRERARDRVFDQSLAQADAQISREKLDEILGFQWRCVREHFSQQLGLGILSARRAQARQQAFRIRQCETWLIAWLCLNKNFERDIAAVAPARVPSTETLGRHAGGRAHRLGQNTSANVRRAGIAQSELLPGEVGRRASQVVVVELREILAYQRRLFEFFRSSGHRLGCSCEAFE